MIYLKPLLKKLITDNEILEQANVFNTDEELLGFLSDIVSIDNIETEFSHYYGVEYHRLNFDDIDVSLMDNFELELLKKELILPYAYDETNKVWNFAINTLTDRNIQKNIRQVVSKQNQTAKFTFAFKHEIEAIFRKLDDIPKLPELIVNGDFNAQEWVDTIINKGIELSASDIHIERTLEGIKIRYRVDGTMGNKTLYNFNPSEISNIYVRLKIIGDMNISEKRKSQDGRIDDYEYKGKLYDLRVSTLNTVLGEKVVMRIFSKEETIITFEKLGFTAQQEKDVLKMIKKNNGIVYLAGATGAGKTTTLYTMIDNLDKNRLNIYTVENPVEKGIIDVNQVQVDSAHGNTYPSVLKTLLRQDPDIIVIGEIRETETAELAVRASLTGHLVLTTVHANNALDSISRLTDMGVESYLVGASSIGFLSQRLVKLLCPHCKEKVEHLSDYQRLWIEEEMPDFDYEESKRQGKYLYEPKGCPKCINGHKGRIAVIEIISVDEELKSLISKKASIEEIKKHLKDIGYQSMKSDGINKALNGILNIEELMGQLQN